jgi:hypothetical protein
MAEHEDTDNHATPHAKPHAEHAPDLSRRTASDGPHRRTRLFEHDSPGSAFGAASISLLLDLLRDRVEAGAWRADRARVHALALLELVPDFEFTGDELALLGRCVATGSQESE